ncbi:MAG: type III-B CRISPR module RAMP protein Cmr1 [Peptococcaceae bacterium]|nr:type III-B CRISPR module RAMP protein Cmr1 [Peptococcaceae bacterium]
MCQLVFQCRTITPMFMAGADNKAREASALELRAPSVKGAMRFWWRAAQAESEIAILKQKEAAIFGGTGKSEGKSKFGVRVSNPANIRRSNYQPLPHHTGDWRCFCVQSRGERCSKGRLQPAIMEHTFSVAFSHSTDPLSQDFTQEHLKSLFTLTAILGGLGKRSRRGFGSFQITKVNGQGQSKAVDLNHILSLLELLAPQKYYISGNNIILAGNCDGNYPYIKEITIGKPYKSTDRLLKVIGQASHDYHPYNADYLGFARNKKRLASPIYVSVTAEGDRFHPVITTLNTAFERNPSGAVDTQHDFKVAIL